MIPTDSGANASMDSLIDSTVTESSPTPDTGVTENVTQVEASPESEPADEVQAEPAQEAAPVETEAPPPAEEQPDEFAEDDLSKPDRLSRDGKMHWYKPQRIQKFLQSHQAWRAVQDAVPGASVDVIKEMYDTASGVDQMQADFATGNVAKFAEFWSQENPQSFTQMMMGAPQYLAKNAPAAYRALEQRVSSGLIDQLYRDGQSRSDDTLIAVAQHLEKILTGKFRDLSKGPATDPLAEREAALTQREKQVQQQLQREQQQRRIAWLDATDSTVSSTVNGMVEKALAIPELKAFEGRREMTWMRRDLQEAIQDAEKANPAWQRQYDALRKQAEAQPSEQARKNLVAMKEQFARQVIAKNRKAIIDAATGRVVGKSVAAHSKLQQAATRTEPANAGSPVNGVAVNPKARDAKSMTDLLSAVLG